MYNYADLSDVEFEALARDIMEASLGISLRRFGRGRDGGIDLVDDAADRTVVVQVKHYIKTGFPGLLAALKKEVPNVEAHHPKQYYVVCSCELTLQNINQIYQLFARYMESPRNILSLTELDDFLCREENSEIVKRHYKLWLHSTAILTELASNDIFMDSQVLLYKVKAQQRLFVVTEVYRHALAALTAGRVLLLVGAPGVGKTITSEMLALHFAAQGCRIRFTTAGEDLNGLKKSLSENPEKKEIILLDDCLGQYYFKMKDTQESELLSLIRYVFMSSNKRLIMNSRVTIYKEAQDRNLDFYREIENGLLKIQVVDTTDITELEKAKILYNHMYFSGLPSGYTDSIKRNRNYLRIVTHHNFSPRIMEFVTMAGIQERTGADEYYSYIMDALDYPEDIWNNEYSRRLKAVDRMLLTTLYSLTDTVVEADMLRRCFNRRISAAAGIDKTLDHFELSLNRLNESMVSVINDGGVSKIGVINPSVNDFLRTRLADGLPEKEDLKKSVVSVRQAVRMLDKGEARSLLEPMVRDGSILQMEFESDLARNDFILYGICRLGVKEERYRSIVDNYITYPHRVFYYGEQRADKSIIIECLLQDELNRYYEVERKLLQHDPLVRLFFFEELEEIVELLDCLEPFSNGPAIAREKYIGIVMPNVLEAAESYVTEVDAAKLLDGIDIDEVLRLAARRNGIKELSGQEAVQAVREFAETFLLDNLRMYLSLLPEDIYQLLSSEAEAKPFILGVESVVAACLKKKSDCCSGEWLEAEYDKNMYNEIDWLFDQGED